MKSKILQKKYTQSQKALSSSMTKRVKSYNFFEPKVDLSELGVLKWKSRALSWIWNVFCERIAF